MSKNYLISGEYQCEYDAGQRVQDKSYGLNWDKKEKIWRAPYWGRQ